MCRDKRTQPQAVLGEIRAGHQEEFPHRKGCEAVEGAAQGVSGVPTLGSSQEMTGHGIKCSGLVDKVVTG